MKQRSLRVSASPARASRARVLGALACAFGLGAAMSPPAHAELSDGIVKIGVLTDMSGPFVDNVGPGSVLATQLAVEEFGGKVRGKPIEARVDPAADPLHRFFIQQVVANVGHQRGCGDARRSAEMTPDSAIQNAGKLPTEHPAGATVGPTVPPSGQHVQCRAPRVLRRRQHHADALGQVAGSQQHDPAAGFRHVRGQAVGLGVAHR